MTTKKLLNGAAAISHAIEEAFGEGARTLRSSLPALTVVAVAIASTLVITLGGCANSSGIVAKAKLAEPTSVGLDASVTAPAVATDWWKSFGDSTLDAIEDKALAGNPSIRMAQARFDRAAAGVSNARSAEGFHLNGETDVTRQRFSGTGYFPAPIGGSTYTIYNVQAAANYEFDFFGRDRAAVEAAVGSQRAAQADQQAARIALATNVARTYVSLGRLFAQREVAVRALEQRNQILSLIQQRVAGGLDTNVELRQGEEQLPESRQQIAQLDEQIALTRHALAALTAQSPEAYDQLVVPLTAVQAIPVPTVLPADLLGRRADISAARWRIEAAGADVRNAKASFYPNINLSAVAAFNSVGFRSFFHSNSEQWNFGPALTLPIFDQGRLRANLGAKTADLDGAIETYNGLIVDAAHDAADQLASIHSIAVQQDEQSRAQGAAESAFDLATQRYKAGLGTYLTVLQAETTVLAQRRLAADLKARSIDQQITLIHALGGGFSQDDTQTVATRQ